MKGDEAMNRRTIAVELRNASMESNVLQLANAFSNVSGADVIVFKANDVHIDAQLADNYQLVSIPTEASTQAKVKNFILSYFSNNRFRGFLHIIEDNVILDKDPSQFIQNVENAMDVLDYSIYFSTVTDPCNYMFKKFNPRMSLAIDDQAIKSKLQLPDVVSFTSHSNLCWTIYDYDKLDGHPQMYDENFTIAMFVIIEYLARRRATRKDGQMYYMNQYLSVSDEIGVFHAISSDNGNVVEQEKMQVEDGLFKSMNIDYAPDNNLDSILDAFYQKIKEKMR